MCDNMKRDSNRGGGGVEELHTGWLGGGCHIVQHIIFSVKNGVSHI